MRKRIRGVIVFLLAFAFVFLINGRTAEAANHTQSEGVAWANSQVGKGLDYDGIYGNQCVDLIKYYYDYLGVAGYAKGNACDYRTNALPGGWQRVYGSYQPGDIAVWKPNYTSGAYQTGAYGHVGIVTGVNSSKITVVNQNFANQPKCTVNTFPLDVIACCIRPAWGSAQITASWSEWVENITNHSAKINARINVSQKVQFTGAGVYIWDSNNRLLYQGSETTTVNYTYMNIFYNIQSELGITLSPGQNYTYQMFADFGGKRYWGNKKTFKTTGTSSQPSGGGTATVTPPSTSSGTSSEKPAKVENGKKDYTPKATSLKKVKAGKKKMVVKWKKVGNQISGYQIQYSANKKFKKGVKTSSVKGWQKTSKTIKKVKAKKRYYVRIRTYRKVNGKTYYSKWSAVKSAKIKK